MKWAFKQQEATSQAKGHRKKKEKQHERKRKKSMRKWRRNNYCRQTMNVTRGRLPSLSLSPVLPSLLVYCLSPLHSSTYCCFVLVRPLCCSVYFETYSRCVMWFHFCPFVVVVLIVVALISQPDKEENSQRPSQSSDCKAIVLIVGGLLKKFGRHRSSWICSRNGSTSEPMVQCTPDKALFRVEN